MKSELEDLLNKFYEENALKPGDIDKLTLHHFLIWLKTKTPNTRQKIRRWS